MPIPWPTDAFHIEVTLRGAFHRRTHISGQRQRPVCCGSAGTSGSAGAPRHLGERRKRLSILVRRRPLPTLWRLPPAARGRVIQILEQGTPRCSRKTPDHLSGKAQSFPRRRDQGSHLDLRDGRLPGGAARHQRRLRSLSRHKLHAAIRRKRLRRYADTIR